MSAAALILTRDEATAVAGELSWTLHGCPTELSMESAEQCRTVARRILLEATIRAGGIGWGEESASELDFHERWGCGTCPDAFPLTEEAAVAFAELFTPQRFAKAIAEHDDELASGHHPDDAEQYQRRRDALVRLAKRLGIALPQAVA